MNFVSEPTVKLPASAARHLVQILNEMSRGNAVKIVAVHAELRTQEPADLLERIAAKVRELMEDRKN